MARRRPAAERQAGAGGRPAAGSWFYLQGARIVTLAPGMTISPAPAGGGGHDTGAPWENGRKGPRGSRRPVADRGRDVFRPFEVWVRGWRSCARTSGGPRGRCRARPSLAPSAPNLGCVGGGLCWGYLSLRPWPSLAAATPPSGHRLSLAQRVVGGRIQAATSAPPPNGWRHSGAGRLRWQQLDAGHRAFGPVLCANHIKIVSKVYNGAADIRFAGGVAA